MRQIREILRLKHERGLSHRAIAGACGVGVGTVSEYVGRAVRAGLSWPLPPELDEAALEARLFADSVSAMDHSCPSCGSTHVTRSHRRGIQEAVVLQRERAIGGEFGLGPSGQGARDSVPGGME